MERTNKKALLEAVLFQAAEPLPLERIMRLISSTSIEKVQGMLNDMKEQLKSEDRGIQLLETQAGWQLRVKPEYLQNVRGLTPFHDLSRGLLRVLALVAYKQPITQSEIVKVIGNRTYEYVKDLEKRGMIRTVKAGRSKALVATKGFADYFGLESVEDAKKLFEKLSLPERKPEGEVKEEKSPDEQA